MKNISILISFLLLIGCSYTKFYPVVSDSNTGDAQLIFELKKLTVKLDSSNNCSSSPNDQFFGRPIFESQLFKTLSECDEYSDLIISDYSESSFKTEQGFFNEGLAYMSLLGYVGTHSIDCIYTFKISSSKTKEFVSYGPIAYKKETCSGWLFTPLVAFKQWHLDVKYSKNDYNPAARRLWISILSTKKQELLQLINKIKE